MRTGHMLWIPAFLLLIACGGQSGSPGGPPGAPQVSEKSPGEQVYNTHCTLCHGKDGSLQLSGAKDLRISTASREEMIEQVTKGRGSMMGYENVLTKAEIEAVVDHVRTLSEAE